MIKKILVLLFAIVMLYNIFCYVDTNNILREFKNTVQNQQSTINSFERYVGNYKSDESIEKTVSKVKTIYVIHSFSKGIMYVNYTYEHFNKNGESIGGSCNVSSKWYIKKEHGKWIVYDIDEKP